MGSKYYFVLQILLGILILNSHVCKSEDTLRITSLVEPPNLMKIDGPMTNRSAGVKDQFEGFSVDLIDLLSKKLGFKYNLKLVHDSAYGRQREQYGNWTGLVGELIDGKADVAVAQITITSSRAADIDLSTPFIEFQLGIVIYNPNADDDDDDDNGDGDDDDDDEEEDDDDDDNQFVFLRPMSVQLWIVFLISVILLIFLIFLVEKFVGAKIRGDVREVGFFDGFCQKLFGPPRSIAARILQVVFWIFLIIFASSYIANFAADRVMDSSRHETDLPIDSFEDLLKQDDDFQFGIVRSGSTFQYFYNATDKKIKAIYEKILKDGNFLESNERGLDRVREKKGKFAFIMEGPAATYATSKKPCNLALVPAQFGPKRGYGIGTPKNSKWSKPINHAIMELNENGKIDDLENKWYEDASECPLKEKDDDFDIIHEHSALTVVDMAGVFYLLLASLVISVALAFVEINLSTARYK